LALPDKHANSIHISDATAGLQPWAFWLNCASDALLPGAASHVRQLIRSAING